MTPTLNDFTRALLTPDLSFATLADARAVTDRQGLPLLRRTTRFAEARIEWRGGSWLLFLPLAPQALLRIERTAARLRRLTSNLLASYRILPGEMQWCDTLGTPRTTDLILQELPAGAEFSTALETEEPATLLAALDTLQEGLRSLGFNHRNLKPENLRWCAGRFIPLRYHDARFGATGADDEAFEALRQLVMEQGRSHTAADAGQTLHDTAASYTALRRLKGHRWCSNLFEGLVCVEDETGYGFVDASNRVVIPSHFLWANDFHEGRAEVQTAEGMGLIDKQGGYVIPPHYEIVEYDPATSLSLVRRAGNWARFDYLGQQLTRFAPLAELGEEEPAADAREPLPVG